MKTPFAAQGTNQRPTLVRLKSGRLFFATDCQHFKNTPPEGLKLRGAVVALSDDDGETWRIKPFPAATPHEKHRLKTDMWEPKDGPDHRYPTLGYSVATQGPDGLIHLMSSMNHPSLHFAMNEAWILSDETKETESVTAADSKRTAHEERHPNGSPRMTWSSCTGADGHYLLDGPETWYYPDGKKQYEATYVRGRKVGGESFWDQAGNRQWAWTRDADGAGVWTQYWPDGGKRIASHWTGCRAQGAVTHWDRAGNITFSGTAGLVND